MLLLVVPGCIVYRVVESRDTTLVVGNERVRCLHPEVGLGILGLRRVRVYEDETQVVPAKTVKS